MAEALAEQGSLYGPSRLFHPAVVLSGHYGSRNDAMIASVARLYVPDGATVLDCTWGRGAFWHGTDTSRFRLAGTDLLNRTGVTIRADFRCLPYRARTADVVVLDPPYVLRADRGRFIDARYGNSETTRGMTYARMLGLYRDGLAEAVRVLRPGGTCWVKCQDATENRCQRWSVVDIHAVATAAGLTGRDMFVLINPTPPGGLHAERQNYARRNHSYLWIFAKPRRGARP